MVTRVHRGIAPNEAYGEYTGIAKFSPKGAAALREQFHEARRKFAGKPFREATVFEKSYLILLLQEMIEAGIPIAHADTPGHYMEVDTQEDFELARQYWGRK
jgi:phosphoenolpyruvate phosphomutase